MRPRSLALRVTLLVALVVILASAAGYTLAYVQAVRLLRADLDAALAEEAEGLQDEYRALGAMGLARAIEDRHTPGGERHFALWFGAPDVEAAAGMTFGARGVPDGYADLDDRLRSYAIALPDGARLVVAADLAPLRRTAGSFAIALFGAGAVTAVLAVVAGFVLSERLERRLGKLSDAARGVMAGDLSRRLPLAGSGDELDRLTATINEMLGRIEALMAALPIPTLQGPACAS
jgi:HAMP domain-containing protein